MFCNTNLCDADRDFLQADSNRARSLVTIAVHCSAVDLSIVSVACCQIIWVIFFRGLSLFKNFPKQGSHCKHLCARHSYVCCRGHFVFEQT